MKENTEKKKKTRRNLVMYKEDEVWNMFPHSIKAKLKRTANSLHFLSISSWDDFDVCFESKLDIKHEMRTYNVKA